MENENESKYKFKKEEENESEDDEDSSICRFIKELKSLKYLSKVKIKLLRQERCYRKKLDNVVLPFSNKKIAASIKSTL